MTRHSAMADEYIARYESESANESGSERSKRVRPTDLVRLHDNVLQTIVNRQELKVNSEGIP